MRHVGVVILLLALGATAGIPKGCGEGYTLSLYPVFSLEAFSGEGGEKVGFYVLLLPQEKALVLRPLSQEEFASFQIRAVGYELIEREMLAACIVLPELSAGEVAQIPREILSVIKRAVNTISGFEVFPELGSGENGGG